MKPYSATPCGVFSTVTVRVTVRVEPQLAAASGIAAAMRSRRDTRRVYAGGRAAPSPAERLGSAILDGDVNGTRRRRVWAWVAAIVVVSSVVRILLARRTVAPWIFVDELVYGDLARSF